MSNILIYNVTIIKFQYNFSEQVQKEQNLNNECEIENEYKTHNLSIDHFNKQRDCFHQ